MTTKIKIEPRLIKAKAGDVVFSPIFGNIRVNKVREVSGYSRHKLIIEVDGFMTGMYNEYGEYITSEKAKHTALFKDLDDFINYWASYIDKLQDEHHARTDE